MSNEAKGLTGAGAGVVGLATDAATVRELSVKAHVDPRTLAKYLRGEKVAPMCARRIRIAIEQMRPEPSA